MGLSWILSINHDVIQVYYNKNTKLFSKDLIDVTLETGGCVGKAEEYYLVLKVAVSDTKGRLPLVTFLNPHLIVSTSEIKLDKSLGPA